MISNIVSIFISKPVDEVFPHATDPDHFKDWMPGTISSRHITSGPMRVGSTFHQIGLNQGKVTPLTGRVTRFEPNQRWSLVLNSPNLWIRRTWTFEKLLRGTRIHYSEERVQKGFMARVSSLFLKASLQKLNQTGCENLKIILEDDQVKPKDPKV